MLTVVCWKWRPVPGSRHPAAPYTAHHVNVLRAMVRRHLHRSHNFVCVTDDPQGIDRDIRIVPLWDDLRDLGRCYLRLKAFAPDMAGCLGDRFVSIDLDTVIVDDITPLFETDMPFKIWGDVLASTPYNGSLWLLRAGARPSVWSAFDPEADIPRAAEAGFIGSDQAWLSLHLGPGEAKWGRDDGVFSFRHHILGRRNWPLGALRRSLPEAMRARPPHGARIVFFHGTHDPSHPSVQDTFPWIKEHWT
ncbi:MAG: hypothetical protein ACFB6R_14485 [Alphaproteobacteria bacterium]